MTTSSEEQATSSSGSAGDKPDIDQLQADIEQTRQELGQTVEALTAKLDVKSRAKEQLSLTKQRASEQVRGARRQAQVKATSLSRTARDAATTDQGKPAPVVLAGAAAVLVSAVVATGLVVWRRRR